MADGTHNCCGQSWIDSCACPPEPAQSCISNPSAFPVIAENGLGHVSDGMTLRDRFAGQALAGCLASGKWDNAGSGFEEYISTHAFNLADAMLAARQEPAA